MKERVSRERGSRERGSRELGSRAQGCKGAGLFTDRYATSDSKAMATGVFPLVFWGCFPKLLLSNHPGNHEIDRVQNQPLDHLM